MPNKCSVGKCRSNSRWIRALPNVVNSENVFICRKHWPDDCRMVKVKRLLRPQEPPSLFDTSSYRIQLQAPSRNVEERGVSLNWKPRCCNGRAKHLRNVRSNPRRLVWLHSSVLRFRISSQSALSVKWRRVQCGLQWSTSGFAAIFHKSKLFFSLYRPLFKNSSSIPLIFLAGFVLPK